MKRSLLSVLIVVLLIAPQLLASVDDYVSERMGDTLVVKTYDEMEGEASAIINIITADSVDVPAGRVYLLQEDGWYPLSQDWTTPLGRAVVIAGENDTPLAVSESTSYPPLITGYTVEGSATNGSVSYQNDLTVKNAILIPAADEANIGWSFFNLTTAGVSLTLENVLMEHTRWVYIAGNNAADGNFFLKDCYFVNLSGQACRRNGGVYDNVNYNTDTMWVENCTHVMGQGMTYKFRNYPVGKVFFNHNTFVNIGGPLFTTFGYQSNWVVTNNLFVNSNVQAYWPGFDIGETDQDELPMGIINVAPLPTGMDTIAAADRMFLVDANGLYWDSSLDEIASGVEANAPQGRTGWMTQMITMNSRTQNMFDDNSTYPLLTEGAWIEGGDPSFTDPADLMTDQVDNLIAFCISTADTNSTDVLDWWRTGSHTSDDYIYPDFPIDIDLSYTNAAYLTAGYAKLPLGDLNWFPVQKVTWEAQMDVEHAAIETALTTGNVLVGIKDLGGVPTEFTLSQNYPNPFNPTTKISFSIPEASNVTLKVYNTLGQEVATLVNDFKTAQSYSVDFNASNLASGVYIYTLKYGNQSISKKMMLLK